MNSFYSIILGFLQGVGEFLPISSSAHLVIFPFFLNKDYQGLQFDVMLHMATLLAIIIFFFKDWIEIFKNAIQKPKTKEGKMLWLLVAGTIPAGIIGLLFEKQAEHLFRNPALIALNLIFFSIIIYIVDKKAKLEKDISSLNLKDILIIGLFQSIAILPGASRSGMTIMSALILKYKRFDSARISFLLATPIILGAGILEIKHLSISDIDSNIIIAFISSFIFGLISIKFLLNYLKNKNLTPFLIYRVLLGLAILYKYFFI